MMRIISIAWKDTKILFSRPAAWFLFIVLPIVFTIALSGTTSGSTDTRVLLVVVDQARSALSTELIAGLEKSETVRPELQTLTQAELQLSKQQISAALVIPPEFDIQHLETSQVKLELRQQPNNPNVAIAQQAIQSVLGTISSSVEAARFSVAVAEKAQPFTSVADQKAYFDASLQQARDIVSKAPTYITLTSSDAKNIFEYDPRASASAGQLIGWTFVLQLATSAIFVTERQKGTLRRLMVTPTSRSTIMLGTIVGQVLIAIVQMILLVGFGMGVMKLNWGHAPLALAVMIITTSLAATAMGIAMGTFVKTERQAGSLTVLMGFMMSILGGIAYPTELFPQFLRTISMIIPSHWSMQGMLAIVQHGQGLSVVLPDAGILLGFAVIFYVVGTWHFSYE